MDTVTQVQILNETIYISYCANTLGKRLHQATLHTAREDWALNLAKATGLREEKPVELRLEIDLVSYSARSKYIQYLPSRLGL